MPHASASIVIHAPPERVMHLYRDYTQWPRLFPATIRGVRLVRSDGVRTEVEVDHREGFVPNVMTEAGPNRIDLREAKRRYDATFENRFEPVPEGTRYTVSADVRLKERPDCSRLSQRRSFGGGSASTCSRRCDGWQRCAPDATGEPGRGKR